MRTIFLLVDDEGLYSSCRDNMPFGDVQVIWLVDCSIENREAFLNSTDTIRFIPFENGVPMLSLADISLAQGEWISFSALGSYLVSSPLDFPEEVDWIVTDWWASLHNKLPFRHERCLQSAQDYRRHVLHDLDSWQQLLQRCQDPGWLLLDQPVSWLRKDWLLQSALPDICMAPCEWLQQKLLSDLQQGKMVRLAFLPQVAALLPILHSQSEREQVQAAQREMVNWLLVLLGQNPGQQVLRRMVLQLLRQHRPWLMTQRAVTGSTYALLSEIFRENCPDAPVLTQIVQEGREWVLAEESQCDAIQVVSRRQAQVWADCIDSLRPGAIRSEVVRIDRVIADIEAFDVTWLDSKNSVFQLMALYRQRDGRWVLPVLLHSWSATQLDTLVSMLTELVQQARRNELVILDGMLAREVGNISHGRFLPGIEEYAQLAQHTACYRLVASRQELGRVLDFAPGAAAGWQILSDGNSIQSYYGIDFNGDVSHFARRFIPQASNGCQFDTCRLDALPKAAFDTVISVSALERTDDPEVLLWELSERLAPGGCLFLCLPAERWAGTHLDSSRQTNWNEQRARRLCEHVFDSVHFIRLRLSLIAPETFQSGLLHEGVADAGEDEGFVIELRQPRQRQLASRVVVQRRFAMGDALLVSSLFPALRRQYPSHQLVMRTAVVEAFQGAPELDVVGSMSIALRADDIYINLDNAYEEERALHIIDAYASRAGVAASEPQLLRLAQDYRLIAGKLLHADWLSKRRPAYLVVIHMASASPDRIWPLVHWVKLLSGLQCHAIGVVVLGGTKDMKLSSIPRALRRDMISMVAEGSLAETAAAIAVADVLIAPDSGLIHVANAVGTPVIGLFGMVLPELRLSKQGRSVGLIADIDCKGCLAQLPANALPLCRKGHAYCMDELLPMTVLQATEQLLSTTPPYQWPQKLLAALPLPFDRAIFKQIQATAPRLQPKGINQVETEAKSVTVSPKSVFSGLPLSRTSRRSFSSLIASDACFPPQEKIRLGVLSGDVLDGACMRLRLFDPLSLLEPWLDVVYFPGNGMYGCRPESVDLEAFTAWADVFVMQRAVCREPNRNFVDKLFDTGKPVVFELDDWLPALPASHPQFDEFSPYNLWSFWQQYLPKCVAATVSTQPLAHFLGQIIGDVRVLPNTLARAYYDVLPRKPRAVGEPITIGFAGTSTHLGDMRMITQALLNIQQRFGPHQIRFVFWGCVPAGFEAASNVRVINQAVKYPDYLKELHRLNLDIALAPLEDNSFNHAKSDLKWLEYSAVGAASVLSDVAAYQEAKALGLAEVALNDSRSWEYAIARLIEDEEYRRTLQQRSYDYLQRYATMEDQVGAWVELLRDILPPSLSSVLESYQPERQGAIKTYPVALATTDEYRAWQVWSDRHQLREIDAEMMAERMMRQWSHQPEYLLIMPVHYAERDALATSIESLQQQLYRRWKLIVIADWAQPDPIFNSNDTLGWLQLDSLDDPQLYTQALNGLLGEVRCDWVMLLPAGTMLAPQVLLRMGDIAHSQPQSLAIYTDHDCYTQPDSFVQPALKPDFSLDYLRAYDYIGGAVALSFQALASLGGFDPYPSCEVWNHLLRLAENYGLDVIQHIDEVLMHLPARAPGERHEQEAARHVALENHLQRLGIEATVSKGFVDNTLHVDYRVTGQPLVSIIIPTRDKLEYLQPCVESLFERTTYQNFELLIVDNASQNPDTFHFYQDIERDHPNQVRIIDYPQPFNFSAQCNLGVEQARGEYIVLLNNDTEIIQSEWLERMIGLAQRPEVGAVGVRLAYPEIGRIQHAGIVLGLPGGVLSVADHVFEKEALDAPGYMNRLLTEQNYSAVTAACLMVSKQKYQQIGGFDAADLTVLFNDVDFCLKLQKQGLINVYTPYVTLVHHHAKSIGKQTYEPEVALAAAVREQKELKIMLKRWLPRLAYDPAYNRHLTLCDKNMGIEPSRYANWAPHQVGRTKVLGMPIAGGSGEYRVVQPFQALQQSGRLDVSVISPDKNSIPVISVVDMARLNPDVLLVHTILTDGMQHAVKQYREFMPDLRLVFGLDDLVGALPEKSILHRVWRKTMPDSRPRLRSILKHFDSLVVSTEPLRDACRDMNDDIIVVPNRLSRDMWGNLSSLRGQGRKPRVGWVGAQQHQGDLAMIVDVVKETAHEVEWVFMGMCLPELRPYVTEEHPWVPFQTYPAKMAALNLDLAIAPLEINAFNESKSNLRLLEYGVMGWPVICSDIFPYQTNEAPVCRVPNTAPAWVAAIRERIHDLDAAYREGDQLRRWVDRDYWLEDHLDDWHQSLLGNIDKK